MTFIQYCKYITKIGDPITNLLTLNEGDIDNFNLIAPVTITATPTFISSTYPPSSSDPDMEGFNRGVKHDQNVF